MAAQQAPHGIEIDCDNGDGVGQRAAQGPGVGADPCAEIEDQVVVAAFDGGREARRLVSRFAGSTGLLVSTSIGDDPVLSSFRCSSSQLQRDTRRLLRPRELTECGELSWSRSVRVGDSGRGVPQAGRSQNLSPRG